MKVSQYTMLVALLLFIIACSAKNEFITIVAALVGLIMLIIAVAESIAHRNK